MNAIRLVKQERRFLPAIKQFRDAQRWLWDRHPSVRERACFGIFHSGPWPDEKELLSVARAETQREMAVAAIALKRFQLRHGKLPSELAALVPEFLPALPHDWMDGKPLRYRWQSDGQFVLYSVGEDGNDDNGDSRPTESHDRFDVFWGRDWVWPTPATAKEIADYSEKIRRERYWFGRGRGSSDATPTVGTFPINQSATNAPK